MSLVQRAPALLLDTCAVIRLANGKLNNPAVADALMHAGLSDGVFVSPVSAWEIGLLAALQPPRIDFLPDAKTWFARFMVQPAIRLVELTNDIAIESASLPGDFHRDPADRLIVATARSLNMPVVTSDRRILAYAESGHVDAVAC